MGYLQNHICLNGVFFLRERIMFFQLTGTG